MSVPAHASRVLVATGALSRELRAPVVTAALGRGLERAGLAPPDLCPVADGGPGTLEVLLPALGGETADGFALIEERGTAIVELAAAPAATGRRVAAAVQTGARVIVLAAAGAEGDEAADGEAVADLIQRAGGLRGARLVVLCGARDSALPAGGLGAVLAGRLGAQLVPGAPFVLDALGFDARMRAARAVIAGEARLDAGTLRGRTAGEIATRARQSGVPCHAVTGDDAIDRFDARILDLQAIVQARSVEEIEAAGEALRGHL